MRLEKTGMLTPYAEKFQRTIGIQTKTVVIRGFYGKCHPGICKANQAVFSLKGYGLLSDDLKKAIQRDPLQKNESI